VVAASVLAIVVQLAGAVRVEAARDRGSEGRGPPAENGKWIAYSTAPATDLSGRASYPTGSDVFIVRQGGEPQLVARRGNGTRWNVCPEFSPDGTMLAYAQKALTGATIKVVPVGRNGISRRAQMIVKVPGNAARCPKWSTHGKRLGYVDRRGKVIVLGLDGSVRPARRGDPALADFDRNADTLVSPAGHLTAQLVNCEIVVSRRNGPGKRVIPDYPCGYAIAAWSPDETKLLVMKDVSGFHFTMVAVSVNPPFPATPVVVRVRVNHSRSWPRYGDVSWQPIPKR
jgi:hypothetical protein